MVSQGFRAGNDVKITAMDGYLFFDSVTPETRSALFEMVEDELLRLAAVTVSGSVAAFAAYTAPDVRSAYALVEAVAETVGRPSARLLAVSGRQGEAAVGRPGHGGVRGRARRRLGAAAGAAVAGGGRGDPGRADR